MTGAEKRLPQLFLRKPPVSETAYSRCCHENTPIIAGAGREVTFMFVSLVSALVLSARVDEAAAEAYTIRVFGLLGVDTDCSPQYSLSDFSSWIGAAFECVLNSVKVQYAKISNAQMKGTVSEWILLLTTALKRLTQKIMRVPSQPHDAPRTTHCASSGTYVVVLDLPILANRVKHVQYRQFPRYSDGLRGEGCTAGGGRDLYVKW
ncbi:hypothetical protein BC835DRAFT_248100 [Cytidiella melzeri]|nr:hypothetical protein BC835DRAFT_248100 [Cytidiella melzeri]